ncbi:MAG: putative porin [Coprobacter sp.]|nr:putative porin [Coprobacter sp.]
MRRFCLTIIISCLCIAGTFAKKTVGPSPYAWRNTQPLGTRYRVPVDTLMRNFYNTDLPTSYSTAYGYTGNLGGPGLSKIFFDRPEMPQFIFKEPYSHWIKTPANFDFYNSRIPITFVSYLAGGSKTNKQEDLRATFSGNVNKQLAFGASADYVLSRGHYLNQATKDFSWQLFGSYIGEKYELQVLLNTLNFVNQENGGISNDEEILHPEQLNGGQSLDSRSVNINLNNAYNRVRGKNYYATQRYHLGIYRTEMIDDTTEYEVFVPVTSLIHTIEYNDNMRRFVNNNRAEAQKYFKNTYINPDRTNDSTSYWSLKNTLGISLLEGFNKYAKMGLSAYLTYEVRKFKLMSDTIPMSYTAPPTVPSLTGSAYPYAYTKQNQFYTENILWVGAEISKQQGNILRYYARGQLGLTGPEAGSTDIDGYVDTHFPIRKDTVQVRAYGFFRNTEPAFYYKHYVSNHFIWDNSDFGKTRKFRVGGELSIPRWGTRLNAGIENIQNYVYFDADCLPKQEKSILQVFSATLEQNFRFGWFNLDNQVVYQKSSKPSVIPLPELSVYSNLYFMFRIAKVLHVQLGADCRYFTRYYGEAYQPATLSFHTQNETKIGGYPLMNAYLNMKLKQTRFYVMYSHFNQGLFGGNNSFTLPHYPLPPAMLQIGVSVDFAN